MAWGIVSITAGNWLSQHGGRSPTSGRHEPLNERWVCHSYKELPRRCPEREHCALLRRVEREEAWPVEGITAADGSAGVSSRHAQLHRIECGFRVKRGLSPIPKEEGPVGAGRATAGGGGDGALPGAVRLPSPVTREGHFTTR